MNLKLPQDKEIEILFDSPQSYSTLHKATMALKIKNKLPAIPKQSNFLKKSPSVRALSNSKKVTVEDQNWSDFSIKNTEKKKN